MPGGWHTFLDNRGKSMIPSDNNQDKRSENNNNQRKEQVDNNRKDTRQPEGLTEDELPESDNESIGATGSGQRQDSN